MANTIDIYTLDEFTTAYLEAALWSSIQSDEQGNEIGALDARFSTSDIAQPSLAAMVEDCRNFQEAQAALLAQVGEDSQHGHDYWLTRNRHGAGFWDRGYPKAIGDALTAAAHADGECVLEVGDDGKIHLMDERAREPASQASSSEGGSGGGPDQSGDERAGEPVTCRTQEELDRVLAEQPGVTVDLRGDKTFAVTVADREASRHFCVLDNAGLVLTVSGDASPSVYAGDSGSVRVLAHGQSNVTLNTHGNASADIDMWGGSEVSAAATDRSEIFVLAHGDSKPSVIGFGDSMTAVMMDERSQAVLKIDDQSRQSARLFDHAHAKAEVRGSGKLSVNVCSPESDTGVDVTLLDRAQLDIRGGQRQVIVEDRRALTQEQKREQAPKPTQAPAHKQAGSIDFDR